MSILKTCKEFIAKNIISARVWIWNLFIYPKQTSSEFQLQFTVTLCYLLLNLLLYIHIMYIHCIYIVWSFFIIIYWLLW